MTYMWNSALLDQRLFTLLGSHLIFILISVALFFFPGSGSYIFPAYGFLFLWSDYRREAETNVLFVFLATMAGLFLIAQQGYPSARFALFLEIGGLWAWSSCLGLFRRRMMKDEIVLQREMSDLDQAISEHERDMRFYSAYEENVSSQIHLRRDLTEVAKSLGSTMDSEEIRSRLLKILETRYPGAKIRIVPGVPQDPLVEWSTNTQAPVLVKDILSDERFSFPKEQEPFRSALVVPLHILRRTAGFLRLESEQPGAFRANDLRTVDLFSTMASLSLENIQLFENVSNLAIHDGLTQLYTHRAFQGKLQEEILRAGRSQTPFSLIMGDVDDFKKYNDTYGHQAGDLLLRTLASILMNHVRPVDFVARYGGEEFCVILPNIVRSQAVELANRIRMKVESDPFLFQSRPTRVTISFGVSAFPQDATMPSQLVRAADERLYRAKENGRNQVIG